MNLWIMTGIGGLFLGIIGLVGLWLWNRVTQSITSQGALTTKEFLGVVDVKKSVIYLPNNRYRSLLEVQSVNYPLMSEEEQDALEIKFSTFLARLSFPIQFYDQSRPLDMEFFLAKMRDQQQNAPKNLQEYMKTTIDYMAGWTLDRPIMIRKKYCIVPYDAPPDMPEEDCLAELDRRTRMVQQGLDTCGLGSRVLYTEEILDVLYVFFNKPQSVSMRFRDAIDGGFNAWEVRGDVIATQAEKEKSEEFQEAFNI